ncbi:MAG: hypothetical protein CND86_01880 [Bacteroidetes bacterium MED-G21]|nr:MAG: hypothetical protein CND86_01880 [Bacteroidetes bacterium MED-G21]
MIEILRESPQSSWTLILFFLISFVYVYLYNDDARRFRYFFLSLYNKQYQVSYGRQSKVSGHFMPLLSLTTFLSVSFLLYSYLGYCTKYSTYSTLFLYAMLILLSFLILKWLFVFMLFFLFKRQKLFQEFIALSLHYINLFLTPIVFSTIYLYLIGSFNQKSINLLLSTTLVLLILAKFKTLSLMRNIISLGVLYIILYICTIEIAPFLSLLIGLNC